MQGHVLANLLLTCGALATVGCGAPQEQLVGRPPAKEETTVNQRKMNIKLASDKKVKRPNDQPEAAFSINGWPLQEEGTNFRLTWDGPTMKMKVVDIPSYNGILSDEVDFRRGEQIRWDGTNVGVFEPSFYRAKTKVMLEGYVYDPSGGYRTGGEGFSAELRPGERVELWHYAGSGLCYLGVRQKMVEALCPLQDQFDGNFRGQTRAATYQPADSVWWIRVPGPKGGGWFPLDDRVIVDIEK